MVVHDVANGLACFIEGHDDEPTLLGFEVRYLTRSELLQSANYTNALGYMGSEKPDIQAE